MLDPLQLSGELLGSKSHETIRRELALSLGENSVHGSDSDENAAIEIAYFFSGIELVG